MPDYRGTAGRQDQAKALAGVLLVHAGLAAVILSGLNVHSVARTIERLKTFDIAIPPPPPPPPPTPRASRPKDQEGAAAKKALPTPVVAPRPKIIIPTKPPIVSAPVPSTGSATTAGAATSGTGTGAGGSGTGLGGGGSGGTAGFTPAVLVRNLTRSDYRALTAGRLPRGSAMVALTIDASGAPRGCRVSRSSGDSQVDSGLCPLVTRRLRFRPARDASGRAIEYSLQYVANWSL